MARTPISENVRASFRQTRDALGGAGALLRDQHRDRLLSQVDVLTDSPEGLAFLLDEIPHLLDAGLFAGTPWEDPGGLVPSLVGGTLKAGGRNALLEILSELRLLAAAEGRSGDEGFASARARAFLQAALVNNLDLVFPEGAEAERESDPGARVKIGHLMALLTERLPLEGMKEALATELELISAQRPVVTDRILEMCRLLRRHLRLDPEEDADRRILRYLDAAFAPSPAAGERSLEAYEAFIAGAERAALEEECRLLGRGMADTGLSVGYHALLLRRVASDPELVGHLLALDEVGRVELQEHGDLVEALVLEAVHPDTARACHGLGRLLERRRLSEQPVRTRLERLLELELHPSVADALTAAGPESSVSPSARLLADCLGVLGQPLGVGQGWNPTCQAARGISLWSRHAPGKLLAMVDSAARTGDLVMRFEGASIRASEVIHDPSGGFDHNLDALSIVLVPRLDRIYQEMMRRASWRGDDPHRWVNPAMYGQWISSGFLSAYHYPTDSVRDYEAFVRTFYATHHPRYNGGHDLAYPNPVGIFLTSAAGSLIGFHAVSILRVPEAGDGEVRVHFLNPNNEGRQQWAADIRPAVAGHGEAPGESSLPFEQFASRLYAFHYDPGDLGDPAAVDADRVERVVQAARESWGRSYTWSGG